MTRDDAAAVRVLSVAADEAGRDLSFAPLEADPKLVEAFVEGGMER